MYVYKDTNALPSVEGGRTAVPAAVWRASLKGAMHDD